MKFGMQSSDNHDDEATRYAPRWAREGSPGPRPRLESLRLPEAPQLMMPVSERTRPQNLDDPVNSDLALQRLVQRRPLDPQPIPEPPPSERGIITFGIIVRLLGAIGAATVIALFVIGAIPNPFPQRAPDAPGGADRAPAIAATSTAPRGAQVDAEEADRPGSGAANAAPSREETRAEPSGPLKVQTQRVVFPSPSSPPAGATPPQVAALPPAADPASEVPSPGGASAAAPAREPIAPEEVRGWVKRGEDFLAQGDIAAGRLLLQRAAEAGDAQAAFILGGTFDPEILRRMGVIGVKPDIRQARLWYERAAAAGWAEAARRLARLPPSAP